MTYTYINANPPAGEWHQITGRRLNGTNRVFLDGVLQTASTTGVSGNTRDNLPTSIGRFYSDTASLTFDGELDDAFVCRRGLSDEEIATIALRRGIIAETKPEYVPIGEAAPPGQSFSATIQRSEGRVIGDPPTRNRNRRVVYT